MSPNEQRKMHEKAYEVGASTVDAYGNRYPSPILLTPKKVYKVMDNDVPPSECLDRPVFDAWASREQVVSTE
jgi:hypothetical protein